MDEDGQDEVGWRQSGLLEGGPEGAVPAVAAGP